MTPNDYKWSVEMCLKLIRSALTDVVPDEQLFDGLTADDWMRIYTTSMAHGVQTIVRDGWLMLDEACYPPSQIRVTWAFEAQKTEKRYAEKWEAFSSLNTFLTSNNVDYILLKGFSTAALYPIPKHRDCGDIDIFSFQHDKIDRLVREQGVEVDSSPCEEKHTLFLWNGTPVENHLVISFEERLKSSEKVSEIFTSILKNEARKQTVVGMKGETIDVNVIPYSMLMEYNAYHLLGHYAWNNISIRQLVDWYLLRKSFPKDYPFNENLGSLRLYVSVLDELSSYYFSDSKSPLSTLAKKYIKSIYGVQCLAEKPTLRYYLSIGKRWKHFTERYTKYSSLAYEDRVTIWDISCDLWNRYVLRKMK